MKYKLLMWSAAGVGLLGAGIRIAEYRYTIDGAGAFYLDTPLTAPLRNGLTVVLAVGVLWSILFGMIGRKDPVELSASMGYCLYHRLLFGLLGLLTLADGAMQLLAVWPTPTRGAIIMAGVCAVAAVGWFCMLHSPKRAGLFAALPAIRLIVQVYAYFWQTHKFIHNSSYILGMVGICTTLLFVISLARIAVGPRITRGNVALTAGCVLTVVPAAVVAPVVRWSINGAVEGAFGLVLLLLAGRLLWDLDRAPAPPLEVEPEGPSLEPLNAYVESLPDPDEE